MKRSTTILFAGLIAGTLDAAAAIVLYAKPVNLHNIAGIFRYISSGLFGKIAFSDGLIYPIVGLVMHYLIAMIWAAVYGLFIHRIFKSGFLFLKMILFSGLVWIVMNGIVLPLFGLTSSRHVDWMVLKSFSPILLCVGFPICLILEKRSSSF